MYNDNEYSQPGYESNYEFNPQQEAGFEMENYEFNNEYEFNPELEQNYEDANEFEDEFARQNRYVVRDHRSGYNPGSGRGYNLSRSARTVNVPTYRGSSHPNFSARSQRYPYYNYRGNNYYRRGNYPWYNRYRQGWNNYYGMRYNQYPDMYGTSQQDIPADPGASTSVSSGSNIPGYIFDTIKNLSQQVASTNANVEALQQSLSNGPNQGNNPQPQGGSPQAGAPGANVGPINQQPPADHEMENYEYEMEDEMMNYSGGNEINEMELAAELLETNNEMELDHFLGGLLGGAGSGLGSLLKGIVKKALPIAGAAAGSFFGGPLGGMVGQKIGSAASGMFELELEGLSNEDQEFEIARSVVRLAMDAARELAEGNNTGNPDEDAKNALIRSAIRNAPGLLVKKHYQGSNGPHGHWHRRGNKIIIENAF
ncbi:hypothetical protein [Mucilaginibacter agri]|uniref:Uncharacterized protein n=1 Tax=Mucilaginibacter agri TaxID=2695265 RepID=A0A966DSX7_9SPHI|nr:hypothetical protein [Mucilaginibacter agri]NCD68722.1 hypothetical protein [Mucilaginibacter agri]